MKNYVLLLAVLLVAGCTQPSGNTGATTTTAAAVTTTTAGLTSTTLGNEPVTFTLTGKNFRFFMNGEENPTLRVNAGDTVRIELTVNDMMHDWTVDELNAATKTVPAGQSTFVEFTASEAGTYEYYCSVGTHRAMGMKGTIVVE